MPLPLGWLVQIQAPASRAAGGFEFCNVPGDAVGWNPWWALLSWRLGWRCAALMCAGGEEARRARAQMWLLRSVFRPR